MKQGHEVEERRMLARPKRGKLPALSDGREGEGRLTTNENQSLSRQDAFTAARKGWHMRWQSERWPDANV
jgi:hypothetical protein